MHTAWYWCPHTNSHVVFSYKQIVHGWSLTTNGLSADARDDHLILCIKILLLTSFYSTHSTVLLCLSMISILWTIFWLFWLGFVLCLQHRQQQQQNTNVIPAMANENSKTLPTDKESSSLASSQKSKAYYDIVGYLLISSGLLEQHWLKQVDHVLNWVDGKVHFWNWGRLFEHVKWMVQSDVYR